MSGAVLVAYEVDLKRRGGKTKGHVRVMATCEQHAQRLAVAQTISVSYPRTKPAQWVVTGVRVIEKSGEGAAL